MDDPICWRPDPAARAASAMAGFIRARRAEGEVMEPVERSDAFRSLHAWSVADPARFWDAVRRDADLAAGPWDGETVRDLDQMAPPPLGGARWFPGFRLNFAEELLRGDDDDPAMVAWGEDGRGAEWSMGAVRREVARVAAGLRHLGVGPGDRVAGWLPNLPETVVAMLATAAIGGVWTSCSPDFGVSGIVDRFGQTEPVVLIFADGYRYAGKVHDCTARAAQLLERLPSLRAMVRLHHLGDPTLPDDPRCLAWESLGHDGATLEFVRLPFDHPLYILYSSGTTGLPKCLVHGAGGTLLQHLKEHRLHVDLRRGERLFYFTTCGWMMWNWLVTGLASGAVLVLYDGAPMPAAEPDLLWRMAEEEGIQVFGTSAKYLALLEKEGLAPRSAERPLASLRSVLSTGSPLGAESFDWLARVLPGVQVASIAGGTDIVSCFVLGNPLEPVRRGEIQGPGLGMAVAVLRPDGTPCPPGEAGELACLKPFPSMPVAFWNDADGERYRQAYFAGWPGVWRHGDWAEWTLAGGVVITGRSDATLNPGGVRIGTAEIYRQVEAIEEVLEALVVGQRLPREGDVRVVLFVRLRDGIALDDDLVARIRQRIRAGASPHHVPRVVLAVPDMPRTRSGKLSELAVRDVVEGREVPNVGALANPEALAHFRARPELAID
ncbi:MAG TPA: acetoacetate--CoA ligase [Gemmatimonadales bacterium]|nr:acetoacetate--CoA ligase [Gemmatimonadales bacterium]MCB9518212.1 acetoacetate--CoA ligase [Gemmatimonadales bacterium]HPF62756.1 acetoacetate--CoA ligase [Gemmatimonadales bacterium]HRX19550.1 acetoacetate--CoA ligase [Gemmatimonadales bacterium]